MQFEQRMFAHLKFLDVLADLHGTAFEDFFHKVMCACHPDFLDVRTAGQLGDQGADGLSLHQRKLYACYAPETVEVTKVEAKLSSDLRKAVEKRAGQFGTFVFVHNDRRGIHPQVATLLSEAVTAHPELKFEQMGARRLWHEFMSLDQAAAEDILGCPIPIQQLVYGVGMEDLAPLLEHLRKQRAAADPLTPLPNVSPKKLDFNKIVGDARQALIRGMRHTHMVEAFYSGAYREVEHDEVTQGFRLYYDQIRTEREDPEDILWQLEMHVLGNASQPPRVQQAAWVILAHFFERCDIFQEPPADWVAPSVGRPT
jgi:hypothetical protein